MVRLVSSESLSPWLVDGCFLLVSSPGLPSVCVCVLISLFLKNKFIYFIYLFLAALGLCCCAQVFSSCGERGLLYVVVRGLLIAAASPVAEHGL